ncbi:MAG TPA: DUF937 domain-containing protein [Anaerolineae bacterium]|nr:DUF937 domain-containing protein [Anaerolineae bacterium]
MSDLLNMLAGQLGQQNVQQISHTLGADQSTTEQAINAALPLLINALGRNAESPAEAQALTHAVKRDHDGSILDNLSSQLTQQSTLADGNAILGHVLGAKRNNVETGISQATGLDQGSTSQLLMMLAPVVLGALGKQQQQQGLDADGIAGLLKQERQETESSLGGFARLLDLDGDGDVSDDIINLGTKFLGGWLSKR